MTEILNGKVYIGSGSYTVRETAEEIKKKIIDKLAENRQADLLGKG